MVDEYTETTTTPWLDRIKDSITGVLFGILFFFGSFFLLWWNEGRSIERIKTLDEGLAMVIPVMSSPISPNNNGKLVHFSGKATTSQLLTDPMFGIQVNSLKLHRTVKMYQWKEMVSSSSHLNPGGSKTTTKKYKYQKEWTSSLIRSDSFKIKAGHENPPYMPYHGESFVANDIKVGAFKLSNPFVNELDEFHDYSVSNQSYQKMSKDLQSQFVISGTNYFQGNIDAPNIGDLKISFGIVPINDVSVVGKQDNDMVTSFYTKDGALNLLDLGTVPAEAMFKEEKTKNSWITWGIRALGTFLMFLGLSSILGPIVVLAEINQISGLIVGFSINTICLLTSLTLSSMTIAIAWIFFRPFLGITLIMTAFAVVFGITWLIRQYHLAHPKNTNIEDQNATSQNIKSPNAILQSTVPQNLNPQATTPQPAEPGTTEPQSTEPETETPQTTDPQETEPQAAEPEISKPQPTDPPK